MIGSNALQVIQKRFGAVSQKILDNPVFDEETRSTATYHASTYMLTLTQILEANNGVFPDSAKSVISGAMEFCDLVDMYCSSNSSAQAHA